MALDIQSAVEKTWKDIIPSLVETALLVSIAIFILGFRLIGEWLVELNSIKLTLTDPELVKFLETYGVTKLMPVLLLFAIVMISYVLSQVSHSIGLLIPGALVPDTTLALLKHVRIHVLMEVFQYYPSFRGSHVFNSINFINDMVDEKVSRADLEGKPSLFSHAVGFNRLYWKQRNRFDFIKFAMLWTITICVVSSIYWHSIGTMIIRGLLILLVLSIAAVIVLRKSMRYLKRYDQSKIDALRSILESQYITTSAPDDDESKLAELQIAIEEVFKQNAESTPWTFCFAGRMVYPFKSFGKRLDDI